jgi:putative SOS response-associated peptidase YedK
MAPRITDEDISWVEDIVGKWFGIEELPTDFRPQANIAKTDPALVITNAAPHQAEMMKFSLVPFHAQAAALSKGGFHNAKSETVDTQGLFKEAFRRNRCLIPATAFYDWKEVGKDKIPYGFSVKGEQVFCIAGIWDRWTNTKTGLEEGTFAIMTCEPNALVEPIHDRMPVILHHEHYEPWLRSEVDKGDSKALADLKALLKIFPADKMEAQEYDRRMSLSKNKDNSTIMPLSETGATGQMSF